MSWKVFAGLAVGAGVLAFAVKAMAKDKPPAKGGGYGPKFQVRHGVAHDGCSHFEVIDADAVESWIKSQPFKLLVWSPMIASANEDPQPLLVAVFQEMFPSCEWPPDSDATFGGSKRSWSEAIAAVKTAMASFDGGSDSPHVAFVAAVRQVFGGAQ